MQDNSYLKELFATQQMIIDRLREPELAQVAIDKATRPVSILEIQIDFSKPVSELAPQRIGHAFKSMYFQNSDNPKNVILVKPSTTDAHQSAFELGYKDVWTVDRTLNDAFIYWPAGQTGTGKLILFTDSNFKSGSQLSLTAGGLSISEGSSAALSSVTLAAGVAAEIAPVNNFRKTRVIQNVSGGDIFVGPTNSVNATSVQGIKLADGGSINWRNSAALYAFSVAGGKIVSLEEE